jgi:hypothetical protein
LNLYKCFENILLIEWWVVKNGHYTGFFSKKDIQEFFGKDFKIIKTYEFKSEGSPLVVRAFYMQRR